MNSTTQTQEPCPETHSGHRLVLIDELSLYRRGVAELVSRQPGLSICGEFADRNGILGAVDSLQADLVVMELSARDGAGVDLIKDLRQNQDPKPGLSQTQIFDEVHSRPVAGGEFHHHQVGLE